MSDLKTFGHLKRAAPDRAKVEKLFAKKSDEVLLGALANPDHSPESRRLLKELADARGLQGDEDDGWALAQSSMFVRPFGSRPTCAEALEASRRRRRLHRATQAVVALCVALVLVTGGAVEFWWGALALAVVVWLLGGIYAWRRPSRILLLRPFQTKKVAKALKRFVRKNVAFHGHTFTLADKYVKESRFLYWVNHVPRSPVDIVLIPLMLFFKPLRQLQRWIRVSGAGSYGLLHDRMSRRFTLNYLWLFSWNKMLMVRSSDAWWKPCIDLLMYSSQLIIVDLSWVKQGTEWELDQINRRDLEGKSVFIVPQEKAEYAREIIARFWPDDEPPPPLHEYDGSGRLVNRVAYEEDVASIVSESHLWDGPGQDPDPNHMKTTSSTNAGG